jgi:hypothetical protein
VRRHVPPRATPSRSAVTPATAARMGIMEDYLPETPRFPIAEEHRPTSRKRLRCPGLRTVLGPHLLFRDAATLRRTAP